MATDLKQKPGGGGPRATLHFQLARVSSSMASSLKAFRNLWYGTPGGGEKHSQKHSRRRWEWPRNGPKLIKNQRRGILEVNAIPY